MEPLLQKPYNIFQTPQLTKQEEVYDPNQGWRGKPSVEKIVAAQNAQKAQQPSTDAKGVPIPIDTNSSTAGMEYLNSLYTSPEQEEKLRKASVMNRRILAIGDAIRHIGNIANTVNYAPNQQLNSPVVEEQARYERGKAMRDKANQQYYTYQMQKAAQDAKAAQWKAEQERKQKEADRTYNFNVWKYGKDFAEKQRQADQNYQLNVRKADDAKELGEKRIKQLDTNNRRSVGATYAGIQQRKDEFEYKKQNGLLGGKGRYGNPYTYPTQEGYIELARDLNTNQIGKKGLFKELKNAGIIDDVWEKRYDNMFSSEAQAALLNTAISQWLMTNEDAPTYMQEHFNAKRYGSGSSNAMPGVGGGSSAGTMPGVHK